MKKGGSVSMQSIVSSPGISNVPDVLPLSSSNPAFRVYEDIEPPPEGPTVDMPAPQQPLHHPREPAVPEKKRKISTQSTSSAPPVPTTRRPFDVIPSRLRSLTDISEPPPVPSTRRPSQRDTTVPNTRRFRSLSEDSPIFGSGRDDPPALVPRVRRPSNGSLSENKSDFPSMLPMSGQEKALYSNITPISETSEDFITENNEGDTDADGYITCVHSRDGPQTVVQV